MPNWQKIAQEYFGFKSKMSSFYRRLCETIQSADIENLAKLRQVYPELVKELKGEG